MTDLRSFAVLQARVYEFLEQQDETSLRAIVSGEARLAILGADDARAPARPAPVDTAGLRVPQLKELAKLRGFANYSRLTRAELVDLLADGDAPAERPAPAQEPPPTESAKPDADMAAIATRLRETDTEDEGAAYLQALNLDRDDLLAVAAALGLTRMDRLSQKELRRRVLKQAIGARRKFAGLRKW